MLSNGSLERILSTPRPPSDHVPSHPTGMFPPSQMESIIVKPTAWSITPPPPTASSSVRRVGGGKASHSKLDVPSVQGILTRYETVEREGSRKDDLTESVIDRPRGDRSKMLLMSSANLSSPVESPPPRIYCAKLIALCRFLKRGP